MPTKQQCKDYAVMSGLTEHEGEMYYHQFSHTEDEEGHFRDGVNRKVRFPARHMKKLKVSGGLMTEAKEGTSTKRLTIIGKNCNRRKDGKTCRKPAVYKTFSDFGNEIYRCEEHLPPGA